MSVKRLSLLLVWVAMVAFSYTRETSTQRIYPMPTRTAELIPSGTADGEFDLPPLSMNAWGRSKTGEFHFLSLKSTREWKVFRRSADGTLEEYAKPNLREISEGGGQAMQDLALDQFGSAYVPLIWRYTKENQGVGVMVFDRTRALSRLITLTPRTEIRHVAVGDDGSLYVMGIDPAYFQRQRDVCNLVHKYTAEGKRTISFSQCPNQTPLRAPETPTTGSSYEQLTRDIDRGRIWITGADIYQILPYSRQLRRFSLNGQLVRTVEFTPPPEGHANDASLRIFPQRDGSFLVVWADGGNYRSGNVVSTGLYMSLHSADGIPLSTGAHRNADNGVPIMMEENGSLLVIKRRNGGSHLSRADVRLGG